MATAALSEDQEIHICQHMEALENQLMRLNSSVEK